MEALDNNDARHASTGDRQAVGAANCRSLPRATIRIRHAGKPRTSDRQDQRACRSRSGLGLSDFSGVVLPVEAMVTPSQGRSGQVIATGGLSDLAKESVTNISAVVKKLTSRDIRTTISRPIPRHTQRRWRLSVHHNGRPSYPLSRACPSIRTSP